MYTLFIMAQDPITSRARAVLITAWKALPPAKINALIEQIVLQDLGQVNGVYNRSERILTLNTRLFEVAGRGNIRYIDSFGNEPAKVSQFVSRALHTTIHEIAHAIGEGTDLDRNADWLSLSGWELSARDEIGYDRYIENRPGWPGGPSPWRHMRDIWFPRYYSSKSPFEDFADCVTWRALHWSLRFHGSASGMRKLTYMASQVWDDYLRPTGIWQANQRRVVEAVRARFRRHHGG